MKIKDSELAAINGGGSGIGTTFLKYLSDAIKTIYGIGQGFGGAIRRIATRKVCQI